MNLLSSNQLVAHIKNIIHEDTQLHERSIDLTVNAIHRFTTAGALDFGGSEFEPAESTLINPEKEKADDDYGWWKLSSGTYKAIFNEKLSIAETRLALITPHNHARKAGLLANAFLTTPDESYDLPFLVPEGGCNIKENARLATAYLIEV